MKAKLLAGAALGAVMAVGSLGAAQAAPITFAINPTNAALGVAAGPVVANDLVVSDFARIILSPAAGTAGSFTEDADLLIVQFLNNGIPQPAAGMGSTYSLYFEVRGATGTQPALPAAGSSTTGAFTSLNYTLYEQAGGFPAIQATTAGVTVTPSSPRVAVAVGSLINGTTTLTADANGALSPSALLNLTFNACRSAAQAGCTADESAFFVNPGPQNINLLIGNFGATTSVTTRVANSPTAGQTTLLLNGGGGNLTLDVTAVPEPLSLSLLGMGLLGMGLLGRRRNKTAA